MPVDTACDLEAGWFTKDLTQEGIPPLLKSQGGRFDVVQAYARQIQQRQKTIFIWMTQVEEVRVSLGGLKQDIYDMIATILWPATSTSGAEDDERALHAAVKDVVARVRGPFGDKSHGGAFSAAGELASMTSPGRIQTVFADPLESLAMGRYRIDVHYPVLDLMIQA